MFIKEIPDTEMTDDEMFEEPKLPKLEPEAKKEKPRQPTAQTI